MAALTGLTAVVDTRDTEILDSQKVIQADLTIGDGVDTYPTGGVPFTLAQLGCRNVINNMVIADQGSSGYIARPDLANNKIQIFYSDNNNVADGPLIEIPNTVAIQMSLKVMIYGS